MLFACEISSRLPHNVIELPVAEPVAASAAHVHAVRKRAVDVRLCETVSVVPESPTRTPYPPRRSPPCCKSGSCRRYCPCEPPCATTTPHTARTHTRTASSVVIKRRILDQVSGRARAVNRQRRRAVRVVGRDVRDDVIGRARCKSKSDGETYRAPKDSARCVAARKVKPAQRRAAGVVGFRLVERIEDQPRFARCPRRCNDGLDAVT